MGSKRRDRIVKDIRDRGDIVPVGLFGSAMSKEAVAEREAVRRSGKAGAHADSMARRKGAAGRTTRVGSRSSQRRAAVRDHG